MIRKRDLRERLEVMKFYKGPEDIYLFILITILYSSHPSKYFDVFFFYINILVIYFCCQLKYLILSLKTLFKIQPNNTNFFF